MSILNVWIEPRRALIAVDTCAEIRSAVSSRIEASKLLHLPHANLVLAGRGEIVFLGFIFSALHLASESVDFDRAEDVLRQHLGTFMAQHLASVRTAGLELAAIFETELALIGWSERRRRMAGVAFEIWPGDPEFKATEIDPWRIGPNPGWERPPVPPYCPETMELIAREQVRFMRAAKPNAPIGGRLLLAELEPGSVRIRAIAELG